MYFRWRSSLSNLNAFRLAYLGFRHYFLFSEIQLSAGQLSFGKGVDFLGLSLVWQLAGGYYFLSVSNKGNLYFEQGRTQISHDTQAVQ